MADVSPSPVVAVPNEGENLLGDKKPDDADVDVKKNGGSNVPHEGGEKVGLKKTITLVNGVTIIVGSIIGSGIFISPKGFSINYIINRVWFIFICFIRFCFYLPQPGVQQQVGSVGLSLIVWVFGGLFSMCGAYCYAELGTLIHESGADYAYIMQAMGKFVAFLRLWVECVVVRPVTSTLIALAFSNYIIYPLFDNSPSDIPDSAIRLLAVVCLCMI